MEGPFGIPGKTRRGAESSCLLTLLVETTSERVRFSYRMNEHDIDDFKQSVYLHVLNNWKYYKPENCAPGAALRIMVGQGAAGAIASFRPGGPPVICSTDISASCDESVNAMSWVPAVDISGDKGWSPHDSYEVECCPAVSPEAGAKKVIVEQQPLLFDAVN